MNYNSHGTRLPRSTKKRYLFHLFLFLFNSLAINSFAGESQSYYIATATPGGTFYRVGYAISALVTEDLANGRDRVTMTAINTDGSYHNLYLMLGNQTQFALLQGFVGAKAKKNGVKDKDGKILYDAKEIRSRIRAITPIWKNVEHFCVLTKYVKDGTGTIEDLMLFKNVNTTGKADKNPKFSLGKPASGTQESGRYILNSLGIDEPESIFELVNLDYASSAEALIKGEIVGMNTPAGVPVSAVKKAFNELKEDMRCLNFKKEHLDKVNSKYNLWTEYKIEADKGQKDVVYKYNPEPIDTIAQTNILVVLADVDKHNVCKITKLIYDNKKFFENIHASTKDMYKDEFYRDRAISALPFDLHPGAKYYYENKNCDFTDEKEIANTTE